MRTHTVSAVPFASLQRKLLFSSLALSVISLAITESGLGARVSPWISRVLMGSAGAVLVYVSFVLSRSGRTPRGSDRLLKLASSGAAVVATYRLPPFER